MVRDESGGPLRGEGYLMISQSADSCFFLKNITHCFKHNTSQKPGVAGTILGESFLPFHIQEASFLQGCCMLQHARPSPGKQGNGCFSQLN